MQVGHRDFRGWTGRTRSARRSFPTKEPPPAAQSLKCRGQDPALPRRRRFRARERWDDGHEATRRRLRADPSGTRRRPRREPESRLPPAWDPDAPPESAVLLAHVTPSHAWKTRQTNPSSGRFCAKSVDLTTNTSQRSVSSLSLVLRRRKLAVGYGGVKPPALSTSAARANPVPQRHI